MVRKHIITRLADGKWAYVCEDADGFEIVMSGRNTPDEIRADVRDGGCDDGGLVENWSDEYADVKP